jgi:predicted membrane protein
MAIYREFRVGNNGGPFGFLVPLIILVLFFTAIYLIAKGMFWILSYASPVLFILTLLINYRVITGYFQWIWTLLTNQLPVGLIMVLITFFGYPFVAGYLFVKALTLRSIKKSFEKAKTTENTYTDYEEVTEDTSFLELPRQSKPEDERRANTYDEIFK